MTDYIDDYDYEAIGRNVVAWRDRFNKLYEANKEDYAKIGSMFRQARLAIGLTLGDIASKIDYCTQTISHFEYGAKVKNRKYLTAAYRTALEAFVPAQLAKVEAVLDRSKGKGKKDK